MMRKTISVQLTVLALSLTLATAALSAGNVGENAPDFTLDRFGGDTDTLSDHAGKVVLLFFMGWG